MGIHRSDDPIRDFNMKCAEEDAWLKQRPVCCYCEEHIQHDHFFLINDEAICPDCLESHFRKEVGDYIE